MNMKKLITTAFLMALANVSFGQYVICRPSALTGGPNIVAQRVFLRIKRMEMVKAACR
tara:strand:+ start:31 stop:204 length:174 start_codon:yes stop_codon:yes gene_type:complete